MAQGTLEMFEVLIDRQKGHQFEVRFLGLDHPALVTDGSEPLGEGSGPKRPGS